MRPVRKLFNLAGLFFAVILPTAPQARSEGHELRVGEPLARFTMLTPSSRLYLRYKVSGDERATQDIWLREVKFETVDGKPLVHVIWRWDSVGDQKFSRVENSWFERDTLRPLTVERRLTRNGATSVTGYRYSAGAVVGMSELADSVSKDFRMTSSMPSYNFEMDMELIQSLPLGTGYEVQIPFYEAGPDQEAPRLYTYRVSGEDAIVAPDGPAIHCWIVTTDSNSSDWGPTRFWFSKRTQVLIREQTTFKDGSIFVKSLMTNDTDL